MLNWTSCSGCDCGNSPTGECRIHPRPISILSSRQPYRCPVCFGVGRVAAGFYSRVGTNTWTTNTIEPEECRSCGGTGLVWS